MKTSKVFKRAKKYLVKDCNDLSGKTRYICIAITGSASDMDAVRCTSIIESRLDGFCTLTEWLADKGCIPNNGFPSIANRDRIQQHRHAWLDLLIAEFKAKGD